MNDYPEYTYDSIKRLIARLQRETDDDTKILEFSPSELLMEALNSLRLIPEADRDDFSDDVSYLIDVGIQMHSAMQAHVSSAEYTKKVDELTLRMKGMKDYLLHIGLSESAVNAMLFTFGCIVAYQFDLYDRYH